MNHKVVVPPQTKKQEMGTAQVFLFLSLICGAITFAGFGWDYWQQEKRARQDEASLRLLSDLVRSQGRVPLEPSPPKGYVVGDYVPIHYLIVLGGVSVLMLGLGAFVFVHARKMIETPQILAADAELERRRNTPEMKRFSRMQLILRLSTPIAVAPVPFMAAYGVHYSIVFIYVFIAALAVGALRFALPRRI
ncbi:MAG: hypothetical protein LH614_22685 [Pyrinomonadaceae bacterium]|nr:hypothetical protein [Pyrinomonadaceae bacterium]